MKHWFDWTDEEIAATLEISRTCSVNQKETREERNNNQEMHAIYHDKDSKTHWNDYLKAQRNCL